MQLWARLHTNSILTHLDAAHLALIAPEAALCVGPAHRHGRRGQALGSSLRRTGAYVGNAPDVGAYEDIRECGQKSVSAARWAANLVSSLLNSV